MKLSYGVFAIVLLLLFAVTASAFSIAEDEENAITHKKSKERSKEQGGSEPLERFDFIHYAKPQGNKGNTSPSCYKLLGVKWKYFPVSYIINPSNPQGLTESFVTSTIAVSAETWDDATSRELLNNSYIIDYTALYGIQNFKNAIVFGDYADSNVIGVTSIWYTRAGRQLVEFDMLLNTDYRWGDATIDGSKMDLQNIVTHELGHAIGLDDIYNTFCSAVSMYGYASNGETAKRTLEQPDITGLQKMYGV